MRPATSVYRSRYRTLVSFSINAVFAITPFSSTAHSFRAASELLPRLSPVQKTGRTKSVNEASAHFLPGFHTPCESIARELSNRVSGLDSVAASLNSSQSDQSTKETRPRTLPRPQLAGLETKFSQVSARMSASCHSIPLKTAFATESHAQVPGKSRLVVRVQRVGATLARSLLAGVSNPKVFRGR